MIFFFKFNKTQKILLQSEDLQVRTSVSSKYLKMHTTTNNEIIRYEEYFFL